ncbi:MAG TPA: DUF4197 domain-containing protein [Gammaproteobacteria bacterium]
MRHGLRAGSIALFCATLAMASHAADWRDLGGSVLKGLGGSSSSTPAAGALSESEVIAGLKEALVKGSEIVVGSLGREDGFLKNPDVRIPLPDTLQSIGKGMRSFGMGSYVDSFETSLNRAAEQAAPEALELLLDSVRGMSLDDAMGILNGPDDAATRYFREHNEARLGERFLPIVREATASVGVTQAYKAMLSKGGMATQFFDPQSLDLDHYVTAEAIDGLFLLLAREEQSIRENPVARTTDLLQKVFGSR